MSFLKLTITILSFTSLLLLSCSKEKNYDILIKNHTNYQIDNMKLECSSDGSYSIAPYGEIKTSVTDEVIFAFAEPVLCPSIRTYSDSINSYENIHSRGVYPYSDLNENSINIAHIRYDPSDMHPTVLFMVTFND